MTPDVIDLTRQLVAIPTMKAGDEEQALDLLEALLRETGFEISRHRFAEKFSNLIALRRGREPGAALAFTGHLDTVPLGDAAWSHDPFSAVELEGRLYGRGTSDMKSGVAAFVVAAIEAVQHATLPRDLILVLTSGEERGCEGATAMRRTGVQLPEIAGWVVAEPTCNRLSLGHKGAMFLRLTFAGRTAHSAMPHLGVNAVYRAAEVVLEIRDWPLDHKPHPVLGPATRNVGMIKGGHAPNAVPDRAEIVLDIRTVPGMRHVELLGEISHRIATDADIDLICDLPPVWTEAGSTLVGRTYQALTQNGVPEHDPVGMPFFTDASVLASMAPAPVVIVGPGDPNQAHKTDESCAIAEIRRSQSIYLTMMRGHT